MKRYTVGLITILILGVRSVEAQIPYCGSGSSALALVQSTCRLFSALPGQAFQIFGGMFRFTPQADGGGDGGGDGEGTEVMGEGTEVAAVVVPVMEAEVLATAAGRDKGMAETAVEMATGPAEMPVTREIRETLGMPAILEIRATVIVRLQTTDEAPPDPPAVTDPANPNDIADVPTNDPALGLRGPGSPGAGGNLNTAP